MLRRPTGLSRFVLWATPRLTLRVGIERAILTLSQWSRRGRSYCALFSSAESTPIWNHDYNEESLQPLCLSRTGSSCRHLPRGSQDNLRKRLRRYFDE